MAPTKKATSATKKSVGAKTASGAKKAAGKKKAAGTKKTPSAKKATGKARKSSGSTKSTSKKPEAIEIPAEATWLHDKKWLRSQREALMAERASYTSSADRLAAEAAALMADREPGDVQFDEESGEGDTIAVERDRDLALSAAARHAVEEIDLALERLDAGTYGICVAGGDVIPQERLEVIPEASVCVAHKTSMF